MLQRSYTRGENRRMLKRNPEIESQIAEVHRSRLLLISEHITKLPKLLKNRLIETMTSASRWFTIAISQRKAIISGY
jgi:hypothetical protein